MCFDLVKNCQDLSSTLLVISWTVVRIRKRVILLKCTCIALLSLHAGEDEAPDRLRRDRSPFEELVDLSGDRDDSPRRRDWDMRHEPNGRSEHREARRTCPARRYEDYDRRRENSPLRRFEDRDRGMTEEPPRRWSRERNSPFYVEDWDGGRRRRGSPLGRSRSPRGRHLRQDEVWIVSDDEDAARDRDWPRSRSRSPGRRGSSDRRRSPAERASRKRRTRSRSRSRERSHHRRHRRRTRSRSRSHTPPERQKRCMRDSPEGGVYVGGFASGDGGTYVGGLVDKDGSYVGGTGPSASYRQQQLMSSSQTTGHVR